MSQLHDNKRASQKATFLDLANLQAGKPYCGLRRACGLPLFLLMLGSFFYGNAREIRKFLGDQTSLPATFQWDYKYTVNETKKKRMQKHVIDWSALQQDNEHTFMSNSTTKKQQQQQQQQQQQHQETEWSWMNTSGITLRHIQGDPTSCQDVIYTGHTHDPMTSDLDDFVHASWKGFSHAVNTFKMLNQTCLVFFQIDDPFLPHGQSQPLHPVWGRVVATALVMRTFPKANFLLYLDSDAMIAFPDQTPTTMYQALSYDGYGENATFQHLQPALIINKPKRGWLCMECLKFGLGHGCFNSGALLWRRSKAAKVILQAWWESRHSNLKQNLFNGEEPFHGWVDGTLNDRWIDQPGEQNRLMYIYHTNQAVHDAVWPVPQQASEDKWTSCPDGVEGHLPCLQNDFAHESQVTEWGSSKQSCFIYHYAAQHHEKIIRLVTLMLEGESS
jgi:hypothetical protein